MNRRDFISNGIAKAAALSSLPSASFSQTSGQQTASLIVRTDRPQGAIAPDFIGLGYEISSVARSGLLNRRNRVYVQLARTLGRRGVIRVGGNTSDYARYSASAKAVSMPQETVVNDTVLNELGGFLDAIAWRLIWGLNLGTGDESNAIAEARAVLAAVGNNLLAFEIGNEPDLFSSAKHRQPGYGYQDWLAEYRHYKTILRKEFPGVPLAGPDAFGNTDWVARFAVDEGRDAVLLTHHYYREAQSASSTIAELLGTDPKLAPQLAQLSAASRSSGIPYRICEVNSFSGGGRPGVSDTMASALWVLDYMFTLAANGCSGVNMETGVNQLGFISSYSPIAGGEEGPYAPRPEYYGMLAFSIAAKGQMLGVEFDHNPSDVKAYATRPGQKELMLTLINKGSVPVSISVSFSGSIAGRRASILRLAAPSINATSAVTLGGSEVRPSGTWSPATREHMTMLDRQFQIELRAFSSAIIHIES
jgi:hypothetical protein